PSKNSQGLRAVVLSRQPQRRLQTSVELLQQCRRQTTDRELQTVCAHGYQVEAGDDTVLVEACGLSVGSRNVEKPARRVADPARVAGHLGHYGMAQRGVVGIAWMTTAGRLLPRVRDPRQDHVSPLDRR